MVRLAAAALVALAFLLAPAGLRAGAAVTPTTLELALERSVWQPHDHMVVTGRLTAQDGPLGGAPIRVGINGFPDGSPHATTTTAPDGTYRLQFQVDGGWGFGGNTLTAWYPGNDRHAASDSMTVFQVAPDTVAPVRFSVDPPPADAVSPGQQVTLTGSLRNDRDEPAEGQSVFAVADAGTDNRAFGTVDAAGRWEIGLTVPTTPGEWSEQFPAYRVPVVFEGDWWLAPAQHEVLLTLSQAPQEAMPTASASVASTPSPSPAPSSPGSRAAAPSTETPLSAGLRAGAPSWLPVWLPAWVVSPVFLVASVGVLSLIVGAALLSHARRD